MIKNLPLVSVIVTTHNRSNFVIEAIESIIEQEYAPLEIIVVDDGSTDQTGILIKSRFPHVTYHYQSNQGQRTSLNTGLDLSKGELITFLDSDDLWVPGQLRKQVEYLHENDDVEIVVGQMKNFASSSLTKDERTRIKNLDTEMPGVVLGAMLIRRSVFAKVGNFTGDTTIASFMPWFIRIRELDINMKVRPELVLLRRIHQTNMGRTRRDHITERVAILKEALDRRRGKTDS